jgi:hypothetical protein
VGRANSGFKRIDHRTTGGGNFWGQVLGRNWPGVLPVKATLLAFSGRGRGGVPECGSLGSGAVVRPAYRDPTSEPAVGREPTEARSIGTHDPDRMRTPRWGTSEGNPGPIRRPIGRDVLGPLRRVSQPVLPLPSAFITKSSPHGVGLARPTLASTPEVRVLRRRGMCRCPRRHEAETAPEGAVSRCSRRQLSAAPFPSLTDRPVSDVA